MNAENAEKNLWDQIRSLTQISVRLAQWGITTLLGLLTALFFIRRELHEGLGNLPPKHPLPVLYFIVGNLILWLVAVMFYRMSSWIRKRIFYYIGCLRKLPEMYPDDKVKVYPEIPRENENSQRLRDRALLHFFRITPDNRTIGIHIGILFFFVPATDCFLYGFSWLCWWFNL